MRVGWARRNFMVPLPRFASWEDFNAWLEEQCRRRQAAILMVATYRALRDVPKTATGKGGFISRAAFGGIYGIAAYAAVETIRYNINFGNCLIMFARSRTTGITSA
jgi:hypothetical protein